MVVTALLLPARLFPACKGCSPKCPVLLIEGRSPPIDQSGFQLLAGVGVCRCPVKKGNSDRRAGSRLPMCQHVILDVAFTVVFSFPALIRFDGFPHVQQNWQLVINHKVVGRSACVRKLPAPKVDILLGQGEGGDRFCDRFWRRRSRKQITLLDRRANLDELLKLIYSSRPGL